MQHAEQVVVLMAAPATIDRDGLHRTNLRLLARALATITPRPSVSLVDGFRLGPSAPPHRAVVGGDRTSACIAAASVIAKTTRDRLMGGPVAAAYPGFGFERHMGYATPDHHAALALEGDLAASPALVQIGRVPGVMPHPRAQAPRVHRDQVDPHEPLASARGAPPGRPPPPGRCVLRWAARQGLDERRGVAAGLDLAHRHDAPAGGDQVQLAPGRAPPPVEDRPAASHQVPLGGPLAGPAPLVARGHGARVSRPSRATDTRVSARARPRAGPRHSPQRKPVGEIGHRERAATGASRGGRASL